jgi:hypothetical protein
MMLPHSPTVARSRTNRVGYCGKEEGEQWEENNN